MARPLAHATGKENKRRKLTLGRSRDIIGSKVPVKHVSGNSLRKPEHPRDAAATGAVGEAEEPASLQLSAATSTAPPIGTVSHGAPLQLSLDTNPTFSSDQASAELPAAQASIHTGTLRTRSTTAAADSTSSDSCCVLCGKDLRMFSLLSRQMHVNDCLDKVCLISSSLVVTLARTQDTPRYRWQAIRG